MAIASTTTFNMSAQDFIDLSLVDIGAIGPETGATNPNLRAHALKLLNLIVKALDVKGIMTWRSPRRTVTLTAGTASYALDGDVYDISQPARYVQSGATYGSQVVPMSQDEYMQLPDRTLQGPCTQYYVERALNASGIVALTLYLYPVPPNTGDTLEMASQARSADLTSLAQTLDVTQKWLDAIRWRLTHDLCPAYNVPIDRMSYFRKVAENAIDEALGDDNERGNVQFVPFSDQTYRFGGVVR
jgi:hypothetical protein